MNTYISILRGIYVSGHLMIKMDSLRTLMGELGFKNCTTYIQSGNMLYQAIKQDTHALNLIIKKAIEKKFGFDVPVITYN